MSEACEEIHKTACVIGAGWSGLYALKQIAEEGSDCIAIERRNDVGGLWAISEDSRYTTVADCTFTSSPKLYTEASDFPWPEKYGIYPRYDEVHQWLRDYATHFGLMPRIWLNSTVEAVTKVDGLWHTKITRLSPDGEARTVLIKSKYLTVSTGVNLQVNDMSHTDKFKGFTGEHIHSNDIRYMSKYQDRLRDKTVVCMGGGENASDLSYFGSLVTKSYTLCVPNGQWMQVRNYLTRNIPIHKVQPITLEKLGGWVLPWEYQKCVFRSWIRPVWGSNGWDRHAVSSVNGEYGHGREEWKPVGPCYANFGNKADLMHHALQSGNIKAKRDVIRCEGRRVYYCDGSYQDDVDILLLCTGYTICFPFLPEEFRPKGIRSLYKNIFSTADPTLSFVGFTRPTQGSIPQLAELAAIFVGKVTAGKLTLPPKEVMKEVAAKDREDWEIFFRYSSGRVTGLADGILYSRQVCDAMGISYAPLEVLRTYGLVNWILYLYCPSTVHTFMGKLPERREMFVQFIRKHSIILHSWPQVLGSTLFGVCDLLYYQLGRAENFYNELFDKATRKVVRPEFICKESRIERWWLTTLWDIITVGLIILLLMGRFMLLFKIIAIYFLLMYVTNALAIYILLHAAKRWTGFFSEKYGHLCEFKKDK